MFPEAEFHKQVGNNSFISESNQDSSHSCSVTRKRKEGTSGDKEGGFINGNDIGGSVHQRGREKKVGDLTTQRINLKQLHYFPTLREIIDTGKHYQWMQETLSDKFMGQLDMHKV